MSEALRSLRGLVFGSIVVLIVWSITVPRALELLQIHRDLKHVHAWSYLHEGLAPLIDHLNETSDPTELFERGTDEPLDEWVIHEPADPREDRIAISFEITATWPEVGVIEFWLDPTMSQLDESFTDRFRFYDASASSPLLPISQYLVVFERQDRDLRVAVVPYDALDIRSPSLRLLPRQLDESDHPKGWARVFPHLALNGLQGRSVPSDHSALRKLREQTDPRSPTARVSVLGISLTTGAFLSSVGYFLAALAFAMLGPLTNLRRKPDVETGDPSSWILALAVGRGPMAVILEFSILLVTVLWVLAPFIVLVIQLRTDMGEVLGSNLALWIGYACLVFSASVFAWVALQLRRTRRAAASTAS